jgi:hypothetical protein
MVKLSEAVRTIDWEMKVWGLNGFERSYTLVGSAGEHQPLVIGNVLMKMLPAKR